MTVWTEVSEDSMEIVLAGAVTEKLNILGAKAGLLPLRWDLAPVHRTTHIGSMSMPSAHIQVTGMVQESGPEAVPDGKLAEVARSWARLLDLPPVTNAAPTGQLVFVGQHGSIIVRVVVTVDHEAAAAAARSHMRG